MNIEQLAELMAEHGFRRCEKLGQLAHSRGEIFQRLDFDAGECMNIIIEIGGGGHVCRVKLHGKNWRLKWPEFQDIGEALALRGALSNGPSHEWTNGIRDALWSAW